MLDDFKDWFLNFISSRVVVMFVVIIILTTILVSRIFELQIVQGDEYMKNFTLSIEKEITIPCVRGNIYDSKGRVIAYNELAYSVIMTDTIASGKGKNEKLNKIIYNMVQLIEKNGDHLSCEFNIYLDENDNYCFSVEGTALQRFLADVYGRKKITDLLYAEQIANPDTVIAYLAGESKYGIGSYFTNGENSKDTFAIGMGYSKKDILDIINVRYNLGLNQFQKYISTTIASDVGEKTVAVIMENANILDGVTIEESSIRRYNYTECMSPVIGYVGRISQTEYDTYSENNNNYTLNDMVGKAGIELSMEENLHGQRGSETIYVDNLGKIIDTDKKIKPVAGNDIYLTIDAELQNSVYKLLEQQIAGILVSKIENVKTVNNTTRNVVIPIYDVYYALFDNNIININRLDKSYASGTEKKVYSQFLTKQTDVLNSVKKEMLTGNQAYEELSEEYQVYESFIISMLASSNYGLILSDEIDITDETYLNWKVQENISIKEYLTYAISKQWIDISKLELEDEYADSGEIYKALVDYTIDHLKINTDFNKKLYKYMLLQDMISGRDVCLLLWEQDVIQLDSKEAEGLLNGATLSYYFMKSLISNLKISPAQLGLEPCSGSCVLTDPNNGKVLALVSYPGYNNNHLELSKLSQDKSKPLWNYATQQRTAPGSTFKMVSSVAGVEENVVTTGESIVCTGIFDKLNGTIHKCWVSPGAHGSLTLNGAIANSCNNYFYEVGYRLAFDGTSYNDTYGVDKLHKYADMFGLSEKSGVEIMESEPKISDQYPVVSAIGQGTHSFTTVQLARYVTAVANSGNVFNLTIVQEIQDPKGTKLYEFTPYLRNQIVLSDNLWNTIHYGMRQVVEKKKYFNTLTISAAGKTGTAQEATNKANHALFVGYAPYQNPEIAIATRIANGYSSDYAAQVSRNIFAYYFGLEETDDLITGTATDAATTDGGD